MATKKQIRERMELKRAKELEETRRENAKALAKDRKQRAARAAAIEAKAKEKKLAEAKKSAAGAMKDVAGKSDG